ncbi:nucleoside diphosphate-linked moiety X motif 17-like [Penaeus monodon]|uniref:nucleoside diphosphate-linked moiety X motif 17-like n=1 Tax=Penaeus monodon TaxID=6687 RepID=UPI0018A776D3|nr:nucleoside diphosphate-linked moiety X motif 17-like [Penaeus monodon]
MSEPSYRRVVVHARRDRSRPFQPATFDQCLLDHFGINDDFGKLECYIADGIVYLQPPPKSPSAGSSSSSSSQENRRKDIPNNLAYRFQHPPFCAIHKMTPAMRQDLPPEVKDRGVDVGVCIILESGDGRLLLTRRAPHMRTFPGVWVPPGGHVEERETLVGAGLRELREETGLRPEGVCRVLGLWESVYPPVLYMGEPRRHHLVIYLHLKCDLCTDDLQRLLKLQHQEVDACVWLTRELVEVVVYGSSRRPSEPIPITLVNTTGVHTIGRLNPRALRKKMPEPGFEVERLTTGTRYALKLWLQNQISTEQPSSTSSAVLQANPPSTSSTFWSERSSDELDSTLGSTRRSSASDSTDHDYEIWRQAEGADDEEAEAASSYRESDSLDGWKAGDLDLKSLREHLGREGLQKQDGNLEQSIARINLQSPETLMSEVARN